MVLGPFFRDFGLLGKRKAGTDFELEAKAAQFQFETQLSRSSPFHIEDAKSAKKAKNTQSAKILPLVEPLFLPPHRGCKECQESQLPLECSNRLWTP